MERAELKELYIKVLKIYIGTWPPKKSASTQSV